VGEHEQGRRPQGGGKAIAKAGVLTAAVLAAVAVLTVRSLPARRLALEIGRADGTIPGILHVHTNRSDGRGTPDDVAAAAARAGLKFVVLTDHGDAMRATDPPTYRSGVLCLDAVEISTSDGHYIALDMPPSPYPLGGDAAGVVEDVKRLGGFGIVAHPNSPKPELAWHEWDAPFDAIEWLNPDTSWRIKIRESGWRSRWNAAAALLGYPLRSSETIAHLFSGTGLSVDSWRTFAHRRPVVLLAGADAHARLDLVAGDAGRRAVTLPFPGYEASFRSMSTHVKPERPLTGNAQRDAITIVQALRRGHAYTAVDGLATPAAFEFGAAAGSATAEAGDRLDARGPVTLRVHSNAPSSFLTIVWRDEEPIASARDEPDIVRTVDAPGIYRVAIVAPPELGSTPWIIGNPIYVGDTIRAAPAVSTAVVDSRPLFDGRTAARWRTETDRTSLAALDLVQSLTGMELRLRYGLSGGPSIGQYASMAVELPDGAASYDRLSLTARSERPIRVAVQFQPLGRAEGWQRSLYIDENNRLYTIRFDELKPMGSTRTAHPDARNIHDILLVVDTTHAKPGSSGRLWIKSAALQR
jgi:hypothetical protein